MASFILGVTSAVSVIRSRLGNSRRGAKVRIGRDWPKSDMAELFIAGFPLQCFVLHPHRFVALARNFLQPLAIFDFDVPPAIANKPGLLERMRG